MHGRKKVDVSEEQKEIKRKEREKKLQLYNHAKTKIFESRKNGDKSTNGLLLSAQILSNNPDFYTLWNYRREILLALAPSCPDDKPAAPKESPDGATDPDKPKIPNGAEIPDETKIPDGAQIPDGETMGVSNDTGGSGDCHQKSSLEDYFRTELELTQNCLMNANPKSYGAWHHRAWILTQMKTPDFKAELKLCNKALELDERNFHCWDHRRLVCAMADVPLEEEMEFSNQKLNHNFSNYSNWHYRSHLLPQIYGPSAPNHAPSDPLIIKETVLRSEFDLVQNAFFTDPEDSSAWFYNNWLLDAGSTKNPDHPKIEGVHLFADLGRLYLVLSSAIRFAPREKLREAGGYSCVVSWPSGLHSSPDLLTWTCVEGGTRGSMWLGTFAPVAELPELMEENKCQVKLMHSKMHEETSSIVSQLDFPVASLRERSCVAVKPDFPLHPLLSEVLDKQIESCRQLVELEASKWPILSLVLCLKRRHGLKTHLREIMTLLEKLGQIDPKRSAFYCDLRSQLVIQDCLLRRADPIVSLVLPDLALTGLFHTIQLSQVSRLDLSDNHITTLDPIKVMINLISANFGGNPLGSLLGVASLPLLRELGIDRCQIADSSLLSCLQKCPQLEVVHLRANPLLAVPECITKLQTLLPSVRLIVN